MRIVPHKPKNLILRSPHASTYVLVISEDAQQKQKEKKLLDDAKAPISTRDQQVTLMNRQNGKKSKVKNIEKAHIILFQEILIFADHTIVIWI